MDPNGGNGHNSSDDVPTNDAGYPLDAWELIAPQLTEARRERFLRVIEGRTNHIRLVIQDVHDPHNISACMRSAEAFGINHVHVVTQNQRYKPSTVARGVGGWINIHHHQGIPHCVENLRSQGYKLAAAVPRPDAHPLMELPVDEPLAVVFGNEHAGVDESWSDLVDYAFTIPMYGFVESLNISVSAAITMQHLVERSKQEIGSHFLLTEKQRQAELSTWSCHQVRDYGKQLARLRQLKIDKS